MCLHNTKIYNNTYLNLYNRRAQLVMEALTNTPASTDSGTILNRPFSREEAGAGKGSVKGTHISGLGIRCPFSISVKAKL